MPITQTSNARALFDHIQSQADPFNYISGFPMPPRAEPYFEEEWLDFKGNPNCPDDRNKIWSKALSGYANITDGLIIWGVDARKTAPRNIDAASGLRLIPDPSALESQLRDLIRDATNPPVMGVEYVSYPGPAGDGFVVCLIPESVHKPHRAEFANKNYYIRAGDDFLIAEPGLLRTLFFPQTRLRFTILASLSYGLEPSDLEEEHRNRPTEATLANLINNGHSVLGLSVYLINNGSLSGKDIFGVVSTNSQLNYTPIIDWTMHPHSVANVAFRAVRSIHPVELVGLFQATFQRNFPNVKDGKTQWGIIPQFDEFRINITIYAEGWEGRTASFPFNPDDLDYATKTTTKSELLS